VTEKEIVTEARATWPLSGIRVLELATAGAGPYAGLLLHALGAQVIKLENPRGGDPLRRWGGGAGTSPMFVTVNAGKGSLALDFTRPEGAAALKALLPKFDVLLANSRAGALERYGFGGKQCLEINPQLVYLLLTGFGSDGPLAANPAYDSVAQSMAGVFSLYLEQSDRSASADLRTTPRNIPVLADMSGGVVAAAGVMAGLVGRQMMGRGAVIETSLLESMLTMVSEAFTRPDIGVPGPRCAGSQAFRLRTSDGRFVVIHLSTNDGFWQKLVACVGIPQLNEDPDFANYRARVQNWEKLELILAKRFLEKTGKEWETILELGDVPHSSQLSVNEAAAHPQIANLDLFEQKKDWPRAIFRGPWRVNGARPHMSVEAPPLGSSTAAVLAEVLSDASIEQLQRAGIVAGLEYA
jgi:crotonobetainyl-CoA:carnitine CoA-transferase CaiB-like acyl-CoA transferase